MTMMMIMLCTVVLPVLLVWAWRTLDWVWFTPKRIESKLRRQGLNGTHYRFFYGDSKDFLQLSADAISRPLPLYCHDLGPRILPFYHKAIKNYGKVSLTWLGPVPRVTLMDPELVKEVMSKKYDQFTKPMSTPVDKFLIQGLVSHDGEQWVKTRKIINPAFNLEQLKLMLPAFSTSSCDLIRKWVKMVPDEGYLEYDVCPDIQNLAKDVISRTAFGSSYEEGRRIFELLIEKLQLIMPTAQSVYVPGFRFLHTETDKKVNQVEKEMEVILTGMIEKREKAIRMGKGVKNDLLGVLLETNMKEGEEQHGKSKNGVMTTDEVIADCKLFYLAGQETMSALLSWAMILLAMYPNWQAKAREEVLQVYGKNTPDMDGLGHLKIVTMILYEVLRLYSPVSFLGRLTSKQVEIGGINYPPGVMFFMPILSIHGEPEFWGEDAKEFKPERFEEGITKAPKVAGAFYPFGAGPRICIGQNFALIEAKILISMILQHFSFELSPSYIHAPFSHLTVQPQHGAQLRLHKL